MRSIISLLAMALSLPALADTIYVVPEVAEVTAYSQGARVTFAARVEVPAGSHRILLPFDLSREVQPSSVSIQGDATISSLSTLNRVTTDPDDLLTSAQAAARDRIKAAQDTLNAQGDALASLDAEIESVKARAAFFTGIGAANGPDLGPRSAEDINQLAQTIGEGTLRAGQDLAVLMRERRAISEKLEDLRAELERAEQALVDLRPSSPEGGFLDVRIAAVSSGPVELRFLSDTPTIAWSPTYEINLDDGSTPGVTLDRKAQLTRFEGSPWSEVALTLSTAAPERGTTPSPTPGQRVVIRPETDRPMPAPSARQVLGGALMQESEAVMDFAPAAKGRMAEDGLTFLYTHPFPLSLPADSQSTILVLDQLRFEAKPTLVAVPARDRTAFVTVDLKNTSGEPILAGPAKVNRNGVPSGSGFLPELAPGAETTFGFGAFPGVELRMIEVERDSGDKGLIRNRNRREDQFAFELENLTDTPQTVRALYALPFSEQEDLEISVTTKPAPDERNVDDTRGLAAWNITLAPRETRRVELNFEYLWPEDQILIGNP